MKNFLFAALSLVSGYQDEDRHNEIKNLEIQKTTEYSLTGTFTKVDDIPLLSVSGTEYEDYLYTFDIDENTVITKKEEPVSFSNIKEGNKIEIIYDGQTTLEYPPKIQGVKKIKVID